MHPAKDSATVPRGNAVLAVEPLPRLLEQKRSEIFAAIMAHHPLPSTLQRIADVFVDLYPSKAIAIFLLSTRIFVYGMSSSCSVICTDSEHADGM